MVKSNMRKLFSLSYIWFPEIIKKRNKNDKKNSFLIFNFTIKNMEEKQT